MFYRVDSVEGCLKQWECSWIQRCVYLMSRGVFKVELGCFEVLHILFDFITVSSSYISSFSVLLFPESAEKKRLWRSNAARHGTVISGVLLPPVLLGRSSRKSVRCAIVCKVAVITHITYMLFADTEGHLRTAIIPQRCCFPPLLERWVSLGTGWKVFSALYLYRSCEMA